ncbi:glutamate-cysteine ligase modifier subunit [Lycorma delicatula]|uniref:glutamate-cysteine ligase modifier subunit n=1 Tax=Lycorma delicatula TaxID=130591 RepID=UPI003F51224F
MFPRLSQSVKKVCVHTGNVLNINELKKKPGQNPSEELVESLKITLSDWTPPKLNCTKLEIHSKHEESKTSGPEEKDELKISVKIFVTSGKAAALKEALENLFVALDTKEIDSVVLSYYSNSNMGDKNDQQAILEELWSILEEAVQKGKILRIGVSDVDTEVFMSLYQNSKVKPSIIQINLSTCCVVPPQLQEFTKQNEVQLLTHNDPQEFLPDTALQSVFQPMLEEGETSFRVHWTARFLVHVKCRGVLASKGYIVCAQRALPA